MVAKQRYPILSKGWCLQVKDLMDRVSHQKTLWGFPPCYSKEVLFYKY